MTPSSSERRPVFAMVSTDIRRDLVVPLRHFTRLRVVHLYRDAPYGDLTPEDMDESLTSYETPLDLFRHLRQQRPDIVQGVEPFSIRQLPDQMLIYLYARQRRIPLVAGAHISRPLREKYGNLPALLLKVMLRPYVRFTRLFFYLNEGGRRNLLWMGVPEAKLVRHMYGTWGVETDEYTPVRDGREPDWGEGPSLLFVGRMHLEKGIFDLLEAYGRIREIVPDVHLVLIGDGPQRGEAQALVREQGWQDRVLFLGTVKNRDLPPYFRAATLFVAPSITTKKWEEYVGVTNIQAMASGVPVVSTRSGAIPEYVPDGVVGLLVPERDPKALSEAALQLLSDERLRQKMGEAGRAYAVEHYDARQNVERAEDWLIQILEKGSSEVVR
jgi:glycosyltransferase involved in cell wall biosynthesis